MTYKKDYKITGKIFYKKDLITLFQNTLDILSSSMKNEIITQEIIKYPNVIITPHIAYDTQESIDYILQRTFEGITDTIKGGTEYCAI